MDLRLLEFAAWCIVYFHYYNLLYAGFDPRCTERLIQLAVRPIFPKCDPCTLLCLLSGIVSPHAFRTPWPRCYSSLFHRTTEQNCLPLSSPGSCRLHRKGDPSLRRIVWEYFHISPYHPFCPAPHLSGLRDCSPWIGEVHTARPAYHTLRSSLDWPLFCELRVPRRY